MVNAMADAIHAIVCDAYRRFPVMTARMNCPLYHAHASVSRAAIADHAAIDAYRCDACQVEWLDRSLPTES